MTPPKDAVRCHWPRSVASGQAIIEYLVIAGIVIAGLLLMGQRLTKVAGDVLDQSNKAVGGAAMVLAHATPLPPWIGEHPQGEPDAAPPSAEEGTPPPDSTTPRDQAKKPKYGLDEDDWFSSGGGGGGGASGGGGGIAGTSFPGLTDVSIPAVLPTPQPAPLDGAVEDAGPATAAEIDLIVAAANILFNASLTFPLFDFVTQTMVTHRVSDIVRGLLEFPVSIAVAKLSGALGVVLADTNADHTVKLPPDGQVFLVLDREWLAGATKEMVATVLAHEGWHVTQVFTGIMDDFVHYPRAVDIEYEAFVAGAAVWNATKGSQSEPTLNAGSSCVALGEARCKEILATDFGYRTVPRNQT